MLYNNPSGAVLVEYSSGITIDGVIMLSPAGYAVVAGEAGQLVIRNIRSFSSKGNGDAIDLFCCQYALVDGHLDDSIAIYSHRLDYLSLWVRTETPWTTLRSGTLCLITTSRKGCIAINPGDSNFISNVYIEDVREEDFRLGQVVNMRVMFNAKYNTPPGRGIANVTIKNLSYNGTHANPPILVGHDEDRNTTGVTFENLAVNSKQISDSMQKPA